MVGEITSHHTEAWYYPQVQAQFPAPPICVTTLREDSQNFPGDFFYQIGWHSCMTKEHQSNRSFLIFFKYTSHDILKPNCIRSLPTRCIVYQEMQINGSAQLKVTIYPFKVNCSLTICFSWTTQYQNTLESKCTGEDASRFKSLPMSPIHLNTCTAWV